ncbi:LytR family transcriptional regulator [Scytonema sp. UIC 10036]|uniref:LCP family glycopolymer transferase n=1 Tax=Scytonema sp. UIC 10036 TaxID=2304196 RepID=UPI0013862061|nr:LytR family transcriptional regulator [Scytonema sp. UIC 10036]
MVKQVAKANQGTSEAEEQSPIEVKVKEQQKQNNSDTDVKSTGSIPSQLYYRMGLAMPRWLFWILTGVVGITLSGLLVSTLALWTPLWSDMDRTDEELSTGGQETHKGPLPGELWSNISQYQLTRPMNILIMGIEPVPGSVDGSPESFSGNSDTVLLVRLNPENKTIRVLSIPKDTMIAIPEKGLNKVSEANAKGGHVLAARVVSRTLNNAPIDRYIRLSSSGLRQLVDQLDGVEVFVPNPMVPKDPTGRSSVNLVSGWQTLNGEQAEQFVRFREEGLGDLERVQRQQAFMLGLKERLYSPTVKPKLPQLIRLMRRHFDTNLKVEEMMALVNYTLNIERDKFQMTILPGIFSRLSADPNSYWLDLTGRIDLLDEYAGVTISGMSPTVKPTSQLKIAIQNASTKPQLAEKAIKYLKDKGFAKVYSVPDWSDTRSESKIIVQKGNRQAGEQIQEIFGKGQIEVSGTGDIESDITIRIGKDWE